MWVIYVAIAALLGGVINALLGWTQTTDPFNERKFMASAIASFIGAVVIAATFNYSGLTVPASSMAAILALFNAFLAGAGVSSGVSRISGSIAK